MKKYRVFLPIFATSIEVVEANSPEEALELASGTPSVCYHCSKEVELSEIDFETLDNTKLEEMVFELDEDE